MLRYYPSAQKAKPNKNCENIPGSCWVSLRQPNLRVWQWVLGNISLKIIN
ncbi:hypothetical protein VL20_50 [Microcystis panniformis FACHB-1757]|uniref:Uncharacterized protein n=1 Tax=Microcystis panniformis FACHB-1757 TaxID=1638788 RepID=A0A0K1RTS1_9CHRO|nr:hypothetical protein VL20_50 [Microcystis panniformis FACHB-1757]